MAKASQVVLSENEFYLIKAPNGKVLEVKNFNTENGAAIRLWDYAGHPWQQWKFVDAGEGRWRIQNRFTGKMIDLALGGVVEGTWLHQWGRTSGMSQCWALEPTRNGRTRIRNVLADKYIDLVGMNTSNGAQAQIWNFVFAGQSGAGKSSLLNKLDKNLNLETNEISKALGRGKHTTRCTTLYDINSSLVADTPGFSSVDFRGMTKIDIRDNMKDMFDNLHNCKYKDCMHIKEDDCEVKRLVEQNKILLSRYNNYKSFIGGQK